jgi:hypothetical protein
MRLPWLSSGVGLAVLILAGGRPAAADPYVIRLPGKGDLYAFDGRVRLVVAPERGKGRKQPPKGKMIPFQHSSEEWGIDDIHSGRVLIRIRMGGPYSGWYLSCDHRGKEKGLFLSKKPVPGSYWSLSEGRSYIWAKADGPVYQWVLAVGSGPEEFAQKGRHKHEYTAYRVKLARRGPKFRISETSP